jgi:hypothetical protein
MSDSNSEPERYSIDEMLDRLKQREPEQGEAQFVTRSDGSQALKARKRKRRTDQPRDRLKAQNQRMQLFQIAGLIIFVVVILLFAGGLILRANSSSYREKLITSIELISGSKVKIKQFRMNPATASASKLEMSWPEGSVLHRFEVTGLTAKIAPINFLGGVFHGEELTGSEASLFLTGAAVTDPNEKDEREKAEQSIQFGRYFIPSVNIFFSTELKWDRMLEGSEVSYFHNPSKGDCEIRLNQGILKFKGWPKLALDRSYIRIQKDELDVQTMRFHLPEVQVDGKSDKGYIDFTGKMRPADTGTTHVLNAQLDDFQLPYLLGQDLGRFFRGAVTHHADKDRQNQIEFKTDADENAVLKLNLTQAVGSRLQLLQFRFLGQLAIALEDAWYEVPIFDHDIEISMKRSGEAVEIDRFQFTQRGRMVIEGSLNAEGSGGKISGKLRVGIPASIVEAADNRRLEALFSPESEDYRWLDIEVKGTGAMPTDNFKELYQSVDLKKQVVETPVQETEKPKEAKEPGLDTFDSLIEGD